MQSNFDIPKKKKKGIFCTWCYLALAGKYWKKKKKKESSFGWVLCLRVELFSVLGWGTFDPATCQRVGGVCCWYAGPGPPPLPPQAHKVESKQAIPEWVRGCTPFVGGGGRCSFFSNGTESPRFLIWVLMRVFRAHAQRKMWLEASCGPCLVRELGSELKKSLFPLFLGEPLGKHSPADIASEHPLHSHMCFERMNVLSIPSLGSGVHWYSEEHSRTFSERTPFYMHHIYTISISPCPNPNETTISKESQVSSSIQTPIVHPWQSRKRLLFGIHSTFNHVPGWWAWTKPWWCSCPLTNVTAATNTHLPTQWAYVMADCPLWLERVEDLVISCKQVPIVYAALCINSHIFFQLCATSIQRTSSISPFLLA